MNSFALDSLEGNIAVRMDLRRDAESILEALLASTDHGAMLTSLSHETLAVNAKFGELFGIPIDTVVRSDVEGVRQMVRSRIAHLDSWLSNLEEVYADPSREQTDDLVLKNPHQVIRRFTGPVRDPSGQIIGRVWTFLDVTRERRLMRMREELFEISSFQDPNPRKVYTWITEKLAEFYGSYSLLSILHGEYMEFRALGGKDNPGAQMGGNNLADSFCQYCSRSGQPLLVQNGALEEEYQDLFPVKVGFTRYAGVPLLHPDGRFIGTLCVLDQLSHVPMDEEDVRFIALLGMRVSSELHREQHIEALLDVERRIVEDQAVKLADTSDVLRAINRAFALCFEELDFSDLVARQSRILQGILGFQSVGIACLDPHGGGYLWADASTIMFNRECGEWIQPGIDYLGPESRCAAMLEHPHVVRVPLHREAGVSASLFFARDERVPLDQHMLMHLEAVAEQVSLLLGTAALRAELIRTHLQLTETHQRLVQSEKLAVTGTLAATTAHDIRNILSSIAMEVAMGKDRPAEALDGVRQHLDRFRLLAHRLLSYAKPRSTVHELVDLDEILHKVFALTEGQRAISGVALVYSGGPAAIMGDPSQLEHLFVNLVLNAIQAMGTKGGQIEVTLSLDSGSAKVTVEDNGPGISPETLESLFEPFVSTRHEGFGLGLFSCRRIVADHGGDIRVVSDLGVGTRFSVEFKEARP